MTSEQASLPPLEPEDAEAAANAFVAYLRSAGLLDGIDQKQCAAMALLFHHGFAAGAGHAAGRARAHHLRLLNVTRDRRCGHCGRDNATASAYETPLCHTGDPALPDCYRRVTVYSEQIGALLGDRPKPAGVGGIIR